MLVSEIVISLLWKMYVVICWRKGKHIFGKYAEMYEIFERMDDMKAKF
jgi:hypothetical protein